MQMKLLNIALAAALTATLTGCGGDGDATYNKQTVAPIDVGSGTSDAIIKKLEDRIKELENNNNSSNEEELNKLREEVKELQCKQDPKTCGGTGTEGGTGTGTEGGTGTGTEGGTGTGTEGSTGTDEPTIVKPEVKDEKNNAGLAGTTEDVKAVDATVLQNYVRGESSAFDRVFNPESENSGNSTVVGSEVLDNKVLSNIIIARPKVDRTLRQMYAGQNPNTGAIVYTFKTKAREGELNLNPEGNRNAEDSLQNNNISIVTYNENDFNIKGGAAGEEAFTSFGEKARFGEDSYIFKKSAGDKSTIGTYLSNVVSNAKGTPALEPFVLQRKYIGKSLDKTLHGIYNNAVVSTSSKVDLTESADLKALSADAYKNGLVRTFSIGQVNGSKDTQEYLDDVQKSKDRSVFIVRGQERAEVDLSGKKPTTIHETGAKYIPENEGNQKNKTRIFGTLSQNLDGSIYKGDDGSVGDIPKEIWNPSAGEDKKGAFVANDENNAYANSLKKYSLSKGTPNSYQFTASNANKARNDIIDIYNEHLNDGELIFKGLGDANDKNNNSKDNGEGSGLDNALFRAGLTPKPIHLDYVQYGRVSVKADQAELDRVRKALVGGAEIVQMSFVGNNGKGKFTYDDTKPLSNSVNKNTDLDSYFARGLQETKNMPEKGEVTYLGHALTYGLDNSYHGDDKYVSNAIVGTQREGVGNFVRAKADFAKGTVEGNIYNVWTRVGGNNNENLQTNAEEDNLVGFKGDITAEHNTVLGESWLEYGDNAKGTFKGAFFGKGASELAGSVNSVKEGYAKAEWGGVFGAKALEGKEKSFTVTSNIENDGTEKP